MQWESTPCGVSASQSQFSPPENGGFLACNKGRQIACPNVFRSHAPRKPARLISFRQNQLALLGDRQAVGLIVVDNLDLTKP